MSAQDYSTVTEGAVTDEMVKTALDASYDPPREPGYTFLNRDSYIALWAPHMRAALEAVVDDIREQVVNELAAMLPPQVEGDESEEHILTHWIENMALADTALAYVTPEKQQEVLDARTAQIQEWNDDLATISEARS